MASGQDRATAPAALSGVGIRLAIVSARWNRPIVERLEAGADRAVSDLRVTSVVRHDVPGSFELPMGALLMARSGRVDAIAVLGVIIRGETTHYDLVSQGCAQGVQKVQLETGIPVAFGVLAVENVDQALARSEPAGGHNVGEEAILAAVEMARLAQRTPK